MSPSRAIPATTRIENLDFAPDGAALELDGRPVVLSGREHAPSVAALREFYEPALADCYAQAAATRRPSLLGRIRFWALGMIERLFGGRPAPGPRPLSWEDTPAPPAGRGARRSKPVRAQPEAVAAIEPRSGRGPGTGPLPGHPGWPEGRPAAQPGAGPALIAIFADREGVHVSWRLQNPGPARGREPAQLVLTYPLDSDAGRRLQACYSRLAELGYRVAGLDSLGPEAPSPAGGPTPEPEMKAPAPKQRPIEAKAAEPQKPLEPAPSGRAELPASTSAKLQRLKLAAREPGAGRAGAAAPAPQAPEP